jgi:hypothetical protein
VIVAQPAALTAHRKLLYHLFKGHFNVDSTQPSDVYTIAVMALLLLLLGKLFHLKVPLNGRPSGVWSPPEWARRYATKGKTHVRDQSRLQRSLVIKKIYPDVPLVWILISVQFMELIWAVMGFFPRIGETFHLSASLNGRLRGPRASTWNA